LRRSAGGDRHGPELENGSKVAVVGGGPAGAFFSYFLLQMAHWIDLDLHVDIYEPRDFSQPAPKGCNMCGGIISESLVQHLAAEGIVLPPEVMQRGIDSYLLHMDVGSVRIETPLHQKRIAAVHRAVGPRGIKELTHRSFDGFLLELALGEGAHWVKARVDGAAFEEGRPKVKAGDEWRQYDLVVVAIGVNSQAVKLFESLQVGYKAPKSTKAYICEYLLGAEMLDRYLGSSMHVFLLDLPRLEFAALIPKGQYVTVCLLGDNIDPPLVKTFLNTREVRACFPPGWEPPSDFCRCAPLMNIGSVGRPFADRVLFVGDCGSTRLYKDGIGAAYRVAKAAAMAAIFDGLSAQDFQRHFWPACRALQDDNLIGKVIFAFTRQIAKRRYARSGVWRTVAREQQSRGPARMSQVLWDTFTGSAPYRDVFLHSLHPKVLGPLFWNSLRAGVSGRRRTE
jgi:flavin-dependent dehydrogenase